MKLLFRAFLMQIKMKTDVQFRFLFIYKMSSFDSLKKNINNIFGWSDPSQQSNKNQSKSQTVSPVKNTDENKRATTSQKDTSNDKKDINPQITNQNKTQEVKNVLIQYLKNILVQEQVECLICLNKYRKPGMAKLCMCEHQYCHSCLIDYLESKMTNFTLPKCPLQQCNSSINKQTGFFRSLDPKTRNTIEKIQKFYFTSNDPFLKMCPTQKCQGIIPIIENQPLQCSQCQNQFCQKCMYLKHTGKCTKNQAQYLHLKYNYCKCNECGIIVQKTEACDHMTCKCGYQFCYKCGRKWTGGHRCPVLKRQRNGGNEQNNRGNLVEQQSIVLRFLKFVGRIIVTCLVICFVVIYAVTCIMPMILGAFLIGTLAGILFYSFVFIYDKCVNEQPLLGVILVVFFPIAIVCGIYKSFESFWCDGFQFLWNLFRMAIEKPLEAIWT